MMRIDLHTHSTASSCSVFQPWQIVEKAVYYGVRAVVTTNHHDPVGDTAFLKEHLEKHGIRYFPAFELTCNWGDFLIFTENPEGLDSPFGRFPKSRLPADDVAVVWAHPYRFMDEHEIDAIKWEAAKYIDAVEGINGNCILSCRRANDQAFRLAEELDKPITAGSDAHSADMYMMAWTEFEEEINTYSDLIHALKAGNYSPVFGNL